MGLPAYGEVGPRPLLDSVAPAAGEGDQAMKHTIRVILAAAVVAGGLVACSDDDNDRDGKAGEGGGAATKAQLREYCTKVLKVETFPFPQTEGQSEAQQAKRFKEYATQLKKLVEDAADAAPAKPKVELLTVAGGLDDVVAAGGDLTKRGTPEVKEAAARAHAFDVENCGWAQVPTSAVEYAYEGFPATVGAGTTSFELTVKGSESHTLELYRLDGGVTAELLTKKVPTREELARATDLGSAFARPDETGHLVRDLKPGRYVAACLILIAANPPATHATKGMAAEFEVK